MLKPFTKYNLRQLVGMCCVLLFTTGWMVAAADDLSADQVGDDSVTIVTLGDSITKGVRSGVTAEQTFAALVEKGLLQNGVKARVVNVGIGGERTDQALKRLDRIVELPAETNSLAANSTMQPDIVTIMYGTNDSYVDKGKATSRITVDAYRDNLQTMVVELLRRGILPVLMTEPRWSEKASVNGVGENPNVRLEPFVVACRETAAKWRVPLIDHFAAWTEAGDAGTNLHQWTTDGCHPNPTGHQELADLMLPVLQQAVGPELKTRQKLAAGKNVRVVCFGDSVTGVYYHTGSRRAYTDMLGIALRQAAPQANIEMINAGISGHTTENALARIDRDVIAHQPDLVTVMFGLNDMTRVPLEKYRENLKAIVQKCQAAGSEVVLATPNNVITTADRPTEKLIQYCDVIRHVGSELNVHVCDVYRELDAVREDAAFEWRLLMSDPIHPNMAGHKRIATCLAQSITRQRQSLDDVPAPANPVDRTLESLSEGKPVRILAMPPFDKSIAPALRTFYPDAEITVDAWPTEKLTLAEIEASAKGRVRSLKPDLVLISVPRSAASDSDEAFAESYAWIMNWSLNFGSPTWDVVVAHPAVTDLTSELTQRDDLVRRLVNAQDLSLIDRPAGSTATAEEILLQWLQQFAK
ncbi:Arylesterase precursor [Rosistilla carotiformis]|uniref:Arylesterase n=1 Tax=Rosistilla carotiformis TaxID=2528017 RepID=A0A518JM56_9BACT|nr:SGNH/GDSL hydrolase family protein [Rosistilla carotiformis]QDV66631.1 Arylesterase precursor [Rosistilla carotiformis]